MIKIDTAIFDEQAMRNVYLKTWKTSPLSIITSLKHNIKNCPISSVPTDAQRIASMFLKKHFGNDLTNVPEDKIEIYLFRRDLTEIILSFWRCVSLVWTEKLHTGGLMSGVTDCFAPELSRWNGIRERALEEPDIPLRVKIVKEVITTNTLPFFTKFTLSDITSTKDSGTNITNRAKLKNVKWKFEDDLYHEFEGAIAILSDVFSYDLLEGDPRHELLTAMHIPVCPYCNRQYITHYEEDRKNRITADLDHFYCKSKYPYLALSVYNFVPSCQICNSRFKLARDFYGAPHLYPYEQNPASRMTFELADAQLLIDDNAWNNATSPVLNIRFIGEAATNSNKTFHLDEIYQVHKDYIHEIVQKSKIYTDKRVESLLSDFPDLFQTEQDVRAVVYGQYLDEKDAYKRPLAKLTQDILNECSSHT